MKTNITQKQAEIIKSNYLYDPITGDLIIKKFNRKVGSLHSTGCLYFNLRCCYGIYRPIRNHIAAWILYYNEIPEIEIDHKNQIRTDNRIENLRKANHSQNNRNIKEKQKNNKSSNYRGVYFSKAHKKYFAKITINKKQIFLGYFYNELDAAKSRWEAEKKYFEDFAPKRN